MIMQESCDVSHLLFMVIRNLFYVGLPLNFILKKLKDITAMLQVPEYNAFWKQAIVLVPTLQLQQSQDTTGQPPLDVHTVDASTMPLPQSQDDESL